MELILALACDQAAIREDGKLDIRGVFNELGAPGFPASHEKMTVVFILEWGRQETGTHPLRADLVDEQGRAVLTIQGHTEVEERSGAQPPPQTRLVMELDKVVFPAAGRYRFRLRAGENVLETLPLHVIERK